MNPTQCRLNKDRPYFAKHCSVDMVDACIRSRSFEERFPNKSWSRVTVHSTSLYLSEFGFQSNLENKCFWNRN